MSKAGMFKECYMDGTWVGCSGDYSHQSRSILILSIIIVSIVVYRLIRK